MHTYTVLIEYFNTDYPLLPVFANIALDITFLNHNIFYVER